MSLKVVLGRMALMMALGCSDDDGKTKGDEKASGAEEDCLDFIETVCDKFTVCAVEAGDVTEGERDSSFDGCSSQTRKAFGCDRAVRVTSQFDSCLQTIESLSCEPFYTQLVSGDMMAIPAVCRGVIEVE